MGNARLKSRDLTRKDKKLQEYWSKRLQALGYLYRYVSLREERLEWFKELVLRSAMFFPPFKGFNDPFDGRVVPNYDGTEDEVRAFWEDHFLEQGIALDDDKRSGIERLVAGRNRPEMKRAAEQVYEEEVEKLGVICLSERPDDLPMWGYYADSHRGACLRFRAETLLGWPDCFPPMPITYSAKYPRVSFYRDSRPLRTRATIATKAKVWRHEREWRIVRQFSGEMLVPADALDGVIVGCEVPSETEREVRDIVARRKPAVDLLKAVRAEGKFQLEIHPKS